MQPLSAVGEDESLEEGLTQQAPGAVGSGGPSAGGSRQRQRIGSNRLSVVSSKYDIGGKGYLDDAEKKMREMDKSGRGFLSNDTVYQMMIDQMEMQQKLFTMKRIIIVLSFFTAIMALSNLGTAWAAAVLAKDTTVDSSSSAEGAAVMMTKDGTRPIGVRPVGAHYDVTEGATDEGRRLLSRALRMHRGRDLYDSDVPVTNQGEEYDLEGTDGAFSIPKGATKEIYQDCVDGTPSTINFGCPRVEIGVSVCGPCNSDYRKSKEAGDEEDGYKAYFFGDLTIACPKGGRNVKCSISMGKGCPNIFMPRPGSGMVGPTRKDGD